jgi:hypothetical protein
LEVFPFCKLKLSLKSKQSFEVYFQAKKNLKTKKRL